MKYIIIMTFILLICIEVLEIISDAQPIRSNHHSRFAIVQTAP